MDTKLSCSLLYRFTALVIRFILTINGGVNVIGLKNVPTEGGVIIASNHISYLDPPLLGAYLPRKATFMARKMLFSLPLIGWFVKFYAFPVDKDKTLPSAIKEAVRRVKNGELLVIFPEGRRSETGQLLEIKQGIGMVAYLSKAVVIPAIITGSDHALPSGARWLKRARISIVFDRSINTSSIYEETNQKYENITKKITSSLEELKRRYGNNSC